MSSHTPLVAIDAVVLDTETTGLDPAKARIIDLATVMLRRGAIGATLERRINPGIPIPPSATDIHGIGDDAVASASPFEAVWPAVSEPLAGGFVIGHNIGFDLAVIEAECARAGLKPPTVWPLDTRLLAQVVAPRLAGHSLEQLASWLEVEVSGRHTALGDALTTARIFLALVPKLRERGIRTVAEARRACLELTQAIESQHRAGWTTAEASLPDRPHLERLDPYAFRHRCRDLMRAPPRFVPPAASLDEALAVMMANAVSSVFVNLEDGSRPPTLETSGIVTERDVLRAIAADGSEALRQPVTRSMSRPLVGVEDEEFVYRAIARMIRLRIRHLAVTDREGSVIGALSARDLLRSRVSQALSLGDEIEHARDVPSLAAAWSRLAQAAASLRAEDLGGRQVARVVSRELAAATKAAAAIASERMRAAGRGDAPCAHALAVLGSAGRGESLLALDQDNAIVFADGAPDGDQDRWFAAFGEHVADILHEIGIPYCKGGVMAKNPAWRGSAPLWRDRIAGWIRRSRPQDLLSVDIFFDLLPVEGDAGLGEALWRDAFDAAAGKVEFAKLLAEASGPVAPGLGLLGRFKTENGRIDLKRTGLLGIVSAARVLAIRHHILERSTPARLAGVKSLGIGGDADIDALVEAHGVFLDLVADQQIADIAEGIAPSNAVLVKRLSGRDQERLGLALQSVRHLDRLTRDLLFAT